MTEGETSMAKKTTKQKSATSPTAAHHQIAAIDREGEAAV